MSDEEADILEIRGHVIDPGIYWDPAREVHSVDVYTGIELYQHLKLPVGDDRELRRMLEESFREKKRMTIEYLIKNKTILTVKYR
ncbi:hypothetical protein AC249_AIPGENE1997 [Exaiptasia diaphana]|nr:hypothetical protein AC249_AIPGENE1997 [Exaiptasia diaphana]